MYDTIMEAAESVSYTHLDVYKRQVNGFYGMFLTAFVRMFLTVFVILLTAFDAMF